MDAILAQNKAIAQQLTNLNKKIEKLEVASMGSQAETSSICGLCGGDATASFMILSPNFLCK
ncbi:hypothetical protein PIB30_106137, partial [Stylosanthes scabra]|nr:hypothetical protein [Stylosanthes scabra]